MAFEPCNSFCIEVVCRFIKKQNIRFLEKETAEGNTAAFTTGKNVNNLVSRRTAQSVHSEFEVCVEVPCVCSVEFFLDFGLTCAKLVKVSIRITKCFVNLIKFCKKVSDRFNAFFYDFENSFARFKIWFLFKVAHSVARQEMSFAGVVFIDSGKNLKERRFTGTVFTDYADFSPIVIRNGNVFKDNLCSIRATNAIHCVNDFFVVKCLSHELSI